MVVALVNILQVVVVVAIINIIVDGVVLHQNLVLLVLLVLAV
jgi:hypothetical protein